MDYNTQAGRKITLDEELRNRELIVRCYQRAVRTIASHCRVFSELLDDELADIMPFETLIGALNILSLRSVFYDCLANYYQKVGNINHLLPVVRESLDDCYDSLRKLETTLKERREIDSRFCVEYPEETNTKFYVALGLPKSFVEGLSACQDTIIESCCRFVGHLALRIRVSSRDSHDFDIVEEDDETTFEEDCVYIFHDYQKRHWEESENRYKKYAERFATVDDALLDLERNADSKELLVLWKKTLDPAIFLREALDSKKFVERDLLRVFDYEGRRNMLLELKNSGSTQPFSDMRVTDIPEHTTDKEIISELTPIFYNDKEKATAFLNRIKGAKSVDVTSEVKRLVEDKVISVMSCRTTLYNILVNYGLYRKTRENYLTQIRQQNLKNFKKL